MDPQQTPQPGPQAGPPLNPSQYDFITNPAKPPKRSLFSFGSGNRIGLYLIIIGALVVLTLLIIIASSLFGGESNRDVLLGVAKDQSAVIALADEGAEKGSTSQTQAFALAVQLAVATEQNQVIAQIKKAGKVKSSEYSAGISDEAKKKLENAQNNGRYDEEFINLLRQEVADYQKGLKAAHAATAGQSTKELLAADFANTELLLAIKTN